MRLLLAYAVVTALCVCSTSPTSAQQAPVGSDPNTAAPAPSAVVPASNGVVSPAVVPAPAAVVSPPGVAPTPAAAPVSAPSAVVSDPRVERANAWVTFEQERDVRTQRGERLFFPLSLALQAGFGVAIASLPDDGISTRSRALLGVGGGLAAAAMLPTMLASSRDARRVWFGLGSTAFALGLGAGLISVENDHSKSDTDPSHGAGNWLGAAVIVQALGVLPCMFIPGWPSENDYAAYAMLPAEARPDAAARLLMQIDRYEQRVTAYLILSNILSAGVLGAGAVVNDDKQERQTLGLWSLLPLGTALLIAVPRLFVASRNERFSLGQGPSRLGFNFW
jgi:hypothetical protein